MRRHVTDGRRFLVQVLLGVNVLIWGTCLARADEPKTATKPAEYVEDKFDACVKRVRMWRFDPKAEDKHPMQQNAMHCMQ